MKAPVAIVCLCSALATAAPAAGSEGLASDSPLMHPGKADLLVRADDEGGGGESNFIWWSPFFKGGAGSIDPGGGGDRTDYLGGYLRPLAAHPERGDLILGWLRVDSGGVAVEEVQAEYRLPSGFGFGGGSADRGPGGQPVDFGKLTYHGHGGAWRYILEAQAQRVGDETDPGGYAALYDDTVMLVWGNDQEQWRATVGLVDPHAGERWRPAVEMLFVDNGIGRFPGPRFLFLNGTLGFRGGFLSQPARLGRAMGPTGLEFGNPLGFLAPTWNRRLNVWEMGRLIDFRAVRTAFPNGREDEEYTAVAYPFELAAPGGRADAFFTGYRYQTTAGVKASSVLVGYRGKVGFLELSAAAAYDFAGSRGSFVVGLIDWF